MSNASIDDLVTPGWSQEQADCRLLFEQNPQPMWVSSERVMVAVNRAALLHYDFSRDEFLAMSVEDFETTTSLSGGRAIGRHKKKDGSVIDVELGSFAITFGGMPATLWSACDVTHLRRIAAQARCLDLLLATATGALGSDERRTTIADGEASGQSTYGTRAAEVLGPPDALAFRGDFVGVERAEAVRQLTETGRFHGELTHHGRDGKRVCIESCAVAFFDSGGTRLGYVSVSREVTERRRVEEIIRALLADVISTQEGERRRIARELDDDMAQTLTSVLVGLRTLEAAHDLPGAREGVGVLRASVAAILQGIQRIASGLRPGILDHLGLEPALELLTVEVSREGGFAVDFQVTGAPLLRIPEPMEIAFYRIAEEALTNTARHASAKNVSVLVHRNDETVRLVIEDDGKGFDAAATPSETQLGLMRAHQRCHFIGGSMTLRSSVGHGTTLCVTAPLPAAAPESARLLS
jgi:signal transduction histidine kinase